MSQPERDDVLTIPAIAKLTSAMLACLKDMKKWGGIARYPGGFWNAPTASLTYRTAPHGSSTIDALVRRGLAEYCAWQVSRSGTSRFPIAARLKDSSP